MQVIHELLVAIAIDAMSNYDKNTHNFSSGFANGHLDQSVLTSQSSRTGIGLLQDRDEQHDTAGNCMLEPAGKSEGEESVNIESLIAKHHQAVYRFAYRLSGNSSDAEDLTQQAFMLAHQHLDQLRDPSKCLSWIFTIVRNTFFKMNRRKRPNCAANLELDIDQVSETVMEQFEFDSDRLQIALNRLSDDQRKILMMFYFEKLSYKEIAKKLDVKLGTIMSRLSRAKSKLRGSLIAVGFDMPNLPDKEL